MYSDLVLDTATNDLKFSGNNLVLFDEYSESITQALSVGLSLIKGEWFLDTSKGLPLTDSLYTTKGAESLMNAYIKQYILDFEGVTSLTSYTSSLDKTTRQLSVDFSAELESGEIIYFSEEI